MNIRKIETQEVIEKKQTRNKLVIGIILVGVMITSTAGFAFLNNSRVATKTEKNTYNGYEFFINSNGFWQANIQGYDFQFQYSPNETQPVSLEVDFNFYAKKPLYFSSESPEAAAEISSNLGRFLPRMQEACLQGAPCEKDIPEKNCTADNILIIREGNESSFVQEENCVFISGPYNDLVKLSDAFLYKILGVK